MQYLKKYRDIMDGGEFIRDGKIISNRDYIPFDGAGSRLLFNSIREEIDNRSTGVTILDYGCGHAIQWHKSVKIPNINKKLCVQEYFGEKLSGFYRYDPAHKYYNKLPTGKFDLIVIADVMEHVPLNEIDEMLSTVSSFIKENGKVFVSIALIPSRNVFLDGENMHITKLSPDEWVSIFKKSFPRGTQFHIWILLEELETGNKYRVIDIV